MSIEQQSDYLYAILEELRKIEKILETSNRMNQDMFDMIMNPNAFPSGFLLM